MSIEKKMAYITGELAAVELSPDIIKNEIGDWGVGYKEISNTQLGESLENAVDFTQETAPSIAIFGMVLLGLTTILKGLEGDKEN